MCFVKGSNSSYKKTKEDVLVWKKLDKINGKYKSLFHHHVYKTGVMQPFIKVRAAGYGIIHEGYHFFAKKSNAQFEKYFPFKIPKGTRCILGYSWGEGIVGVTDQIMRITLKEAKNLKELKL